MAGNEAHPIASSYIRDNFDSNDRLAVLLIDKRSSRVIQRLAAASTIAAYDFQGWIGRHSREGFDVYISMNALHAAATGRTKSEVSAIRHLYLDLDHNGGETVNTILRGNELPRPNYLINTSPDRWQVIWKVEGFTKADAEHRQRGLARAFHGDPAATDCARVLRLPPYANHKYGTRYPVRVESYSREIYRPEQFPRFFEEKSPVSVSGEAAKSRRGAISQSERDWAFARRALARGDSPDAVLAAVARYRQYDKHNPRQYAELTVRKAADSLRVGAARENERER
jgi:hypothetical protein